ncbi:MAG: (Fe-S)-binding protein [Candidatus Methanoperedens sp.]|nr:(Fe-S)-binding protein [Candidatus Methanoperedens sp.]
MKLEVSGNEIKVPEKNHEHVSETVMHYGTKNRYCDTDKWGLKMRDLNFDDIEEPYKCSGCGVCFLECPIYEHSPCESAGAKGKMEAMKLWDSGCIRLEDIQNIFELCTLCKRCENVCSQEIKTSKLIRNNLIQNGISNQKSNEIKECMLERGHPYREENPSFKSLPEWYENKDTETALWVGCSTRHMGLLEQWLKILIGLNHRPTLLSEEKCCGSILKNMGYDDEFKNIMQKNVKDLSGFKRIITLCPSCYTTFKNEPKIKGKVMFITELLDKNKQKFHVSKSLEEPLMLFEPCHLKNYEPWMDASNVIREILEKNKIRYFMSSDLYGAKCCGGGGGMLANHSDISRNRASQLVNDAQKSYNIKTVVTMCPFCNNVFNQADNKGVKVLDLGAILCI